MCTNLKEVVRNSTNLVYPIELARFGYTSFFPQSDSSVAPSIPKLSLLAQKQALNKLVTQWKLLRFAMLPAAIATYDRWWLIHGVFVQARVIEERYYSITLPALAQQPSTPQWKPLDIPWAPRNLKIAFDEVQDLFVSVEDIGYGLFCPWPCF